MSRNESNSVVMKLAVNSNDSNAQAYFIQIIPIELKSHAIFYVTIKIPFSYSTNFKLLNEIVCV